MEILSELVQLLDVLLHRGQVFRRSNLERHLAALPADRPHDRSIREERMRSFMLDHIAVGDADAEEVALLKGRGQVARVVDPSLRRHCLAHSIVNLCAPQSPLRAFTGKEGFS